MSNEPKKKEFTVKVDFDDEFVKKVLHKKEAERFFRLKRVYEKGKLKGPRRRQRLKNLSNRLSKYLEQEPIPEMEEPIPEMEEPMPEMEEPKPEMEEPKPEMEEPKPEMEEQLPTIYESETEE